MWVISLTGGYLPTQRWSNATHLPDSAALMWVDPHWVTSASIHLALSIQSAGRDSVWVKRLY